MEHRDILTNSRMAGLVERYHTWPTLKRQNVGDHSWQMMRIWWHMWGPMPPEISTAILWHDAGELLAGDCSFMSKRRKPELKAILDDLEGVAVEEMGGPKAGLSLTPYDQLRLKFCDWIEMLEFGFTEMAMGNNLAQPVINVCSELINTKAVQLEDDDRAALNHYMQRVYLMAHTYGVNVKPLHELLPQQEKAA